MGGQPICLTFPDHPQEGWQQPRAMLAPLPICAVLQPCVDTESPLRLPHQYVPNKTLGAFLCKEKRCTPSHNRIIPVQTHFVSIAVTKFIALYSDFYTVCICSTCYSGSPPACLAVGTSSSLFGSYSFAQLQGDFLPQWNIDHLMLEVGGGGGSSRKTCQASNLNLSPERHVSREDSLLVMVMSPSESGRTALSGHIRADATASSLNTSELRPGDLNKTFRNMTKRKGSPQRNLKLSNLGFKGRLALWVPALLPHGQADLGRPLPRVMSTPPPF